MAFLERCESYKKIEELRKRPLVSFVTSHRQNAQAVMASDLIPELARQIRAVPADKDEIDVLIVSQGGDPTVSWRIISMLRDRFKKVGALLPYGAFSAATLFALGADEIVMHPFSNLGPVDPQLRGVRKVPGRPEMQEDISFGAEDLVHFVDFFRKELGITDQDQLQRSFELVCKDVGAIPIGIARRSSHLALSMGEKLLGLHMKDPNKAKAIAEALNKSFYHHGYPVGRKEAKQIGLPVVEPEKQLEDLLWTVWSDIESEMKCNEPFDPVTEIARSPVGPRLLGPIPDVQIPANLPPQVLQQAYAQILNQVQVGTIAPVDYELFQATLESTRGRSEFRTKGRILGTRRPDLNLALNVIKENYGWHITAVVN